MEVSKKTLGTILEKLYEVYPLMLESEGYKNLVTELGSDLLLDAHLLYLWEKGLISTEMKYDPYDQGWFVNVNLTRISAGGIDLLESHKSG